MMKHLGWLLLLTIFPSPTYAGKEDCNGTASPYDFSNLTRPAQMALAQDIKSFCKDNMYLRFLRVNKQITDTESKRLSTEELEKRVIEFSKVVGSADYNLGLLPSLTTREMALQTTTIHFPGANTVSFKVPEILNNFKNYLEAPERDDKFCSDVNSGLSLDKIRSLKEQGKPDSWADWATNSVAQVGLCSEVSISNSLSCKKDLADIMDVMRPVKVPELPTMSLLPVYEEVFGDDRYIEGIRRAALKLISRYEHPVDDKASLYSDIKQSMLSSGLKEKDAENFTWNTIGVWATGGHNVIDRMTSLQTEKKHKPLVVGMSLMGILTLLLDSKYENSGHLYSYPSGVTTTCDNSKPYHFWMAAFLARRQTLKNGNAQAAAIASFTAEKGYQIKSSIGGRTPGKALTYETFDPVNNVIRTDLAYAAAGAIYGVNSAEKKSSSLDVDAGIQMLVANAKLNSRLSTQEAKDAAKGLGLSAYSRWREIFDPNSVFERYWSQR